MIRRLILLLCLLLLVAACGGEATPDGAGTSDNTAEPTATAVARVTDAPTATVAAATSTPAPTPTTRPTEPPPLYRDPTQSTEARVEDLLARMSLDEKIGQMTLIENGSIRPEGVTESMLGAILSGGGGGPAGDNSAEAWLDMVTEYQQAALETRLAIPLLYGVDAVHGHNNVTGATIFPHNIGLGATRNPELMVEIGRATAIETLATGIHWDYAPVLAVSRDIRWGRAYEAFSEDTDVVTDLSRAFLLGLQSVDGANSDLGHPLTLLGTPKHWVADGGTTYGSSTTGSYAIDQGDTILDEATLRAVHVPPYIASIESGAMSIMASYSSWNGVKLHAEKYLMTDVLKEELGFNGFIVSDWQAIDQIPGGYSSDVITSVNAGIDMNMVPFDTHAFIGNLRRAVANGDVSEERIDDAVRRILRVKFELGLFENPFGDPSLLEQVGSAEHREIARQAVRESTVLLQNENEALPLNKEAARIFIAGQAGDDIGLQSGGWTIEWQGKSGNITPGTTVRDAVEASTSADTEIVFDRFGKFDKVDGNADIGIVVIGERPYAEGAGDRNDLSINRIMVERMRERADTVVVILITGRPLIITEELPLADAWVAAWLPGTEGQGIADVLFGDYPFTGKLSFTWPRAMTQLPFDFENIPTEGCDAPLFPFGFGLSIGDESSNQTSQTISIDCD